MTRRSADVGKFKTPTLRQVGFTTPYMHDGSLRTLNEVIDFTIGEDIRIRIETPNYDLSTCPRVTRKRCLRFSARWTDGSWRAH